MWLLQAMQLCKHLSEPWLGMHLCICTELFTSASAMYHLHGACKPILLTMHKADRKLERDHRLKRGHRLKRDHRPKRGYRLLSADVRSTPVLTLCAYDNQAECALHVKLYCMTGNRMYSSAGQQEAASAQVASVMIATNAAASPANPLCVQRLDNRS